MMPETDDAHGITRRHPEEMTAEVHLHIGSNVSLSIAARAIPAGLVAVGVLVSSIILSVVPMVWAARRRRESSSWVRTATGHVCGRREQGEF